MSQDIATLGIAVNTSQVSQATQSLGGLAAAAHNTESAVGGLGDAADSTQGSLQTTTTATNTLRNATLALVSALSVNQVVGYADAWTAAQNSLRQVTSSTSELNKVTEQLRQTSKESRTGFAATTDLYSKLQRSTQNLGLSQADLIGITSSINKSFAASGSTAQEASNAITQLGQALNIGKLSGDEFNSVAEQAPGILRAIASSTGKTTGELKTLAAEGFITAEVIVTALQSQADAIDQDFAKSVALYSQSVQIASDNTAEFIGSSDNVKKAVEGLGGALVFLSENLEGISSLAIGIGSVSAALAVYNARVAIATTATAAFNAVANLNPFVAIASVAAAAGIAYLSYSGAADKAAKSLEDLNESLAETSKLFKSNGEIVEDATKKQVQFAIETARAAISNAESQLEASKIIVKSYAQQIEAANKAKVAGSSFYVSSSQIKQGQKNIEEAIESQVKIINMSNDSINKNEKNLATLESRLKSLEKEESKTVVGITKQSKAQKALNDLTKEGQRIFNDTRTPLEKYRIEMEQLQRVFDAGKIDQDTFNRAVNALTKELEDATGVTKQNEDALRALQDQQEQTFRNMSDNITDVISGAKDFDDVLKDMAKTLLQKAFVEPLLISIGVQGGTSGGYSAQSILESQFGAQPRFISNRGQQVTKETQGDNGNTSIGTAKPIQDVAWDYIQSTNLYKSAINSTAGKYVTGIADSVGGFFSDTFSSAATSLGFAKTPIDPTSAGVPVTGPGVVAPDTGGFDVGSSLQGAALNYLAAYAGSAAADALGWDKGEGIGATVGTMIGSYWGPIGSAVGSFLGAGVDNLFGGSGKKTSFELSSQNFSEEQAEGRSTTEIESAFGQTLFKVYNGRDDDVDIVNTFKPIAQSISDLEGVIARTLNSESIENIVSNIASVDFRSEDPDKTVSKFISGRLDVILDELDPVIREMKDRAELTGVSALKYVASLAAISDELDKGTPLVSLFANQFQDLAMFLEQVQREDEDIVDTYTRLQNAEVKYYNNFYTQTEQAERAINAASDALNGMNEYLGTTGDAFIDTREEFRAFVESLDLGTQAGRNQLEVALAAQDFVVLVSDANEKAAQATAAAAQATAAAAQESEKAARSARESFDKQRISLLENNKSLAIGAAESVFSSLQNSINIEKSTINSEISRLEALKRSASSSRSALRSSNTETSSIDLAYAQRLVSRAAGGESINADKLTQALSTAANLSESSFASQLEYERSLYKTSVDMAKIDDNTSDSLTLEQQSLSSLEAMQDSAQEQINQLKGIDNSVLSISDAIDALASAINEANFAKDDLNNISSTLGGIGATTDYINELYTKGLGREADADGVSYWLQQIANGMSIEDVRRSFFDAARENNETNVTPGNLTTDIGTSSIEALYKAGLGRDPDPAGVEYWKSLLDSGLSFESVKDTFFKAAQENGETKINAFANGGYHSGGLRIVGERGPELEMTGPSRIMNNSDLISGLNRAKTEKQEDNKMDLILSKMALVLDKMYKQQQRWTYDALSVRVV